MRVVVDALAADFGGIRTYVERLLPAWAQRFPEDELHVVLEERCGLDVSPHVAHHVTVHRPTPVGRPWVQTTRLPALVRETGAQAVLATMPSTSLRRLTVPTVVVVHDLRHELRPEQFGRGRRLLRSVAYGRAYSVADAFVAVSQRTLDDLHTVHPRTTSTPSAVVHHGGDHVDHWPRDEQEGPAVAFAHHTNKNPELLIRGWQLLERTGGAPDLLLLGVGASARPRLRQLIDECGLGASVTLAPYLDDHTFRRTVARARLVVFPSDFEGFGLPVVEGMRLARPVVIGPDPATLEVAGGHAHVMAGWRPEHLADAVRGALAADADRVELARRWAGRFTWERTAERTRAVLAERV